MDLREVVFELLGEVSLFDLDLSQSVVSVDVVGVFFDEQLEVVVFDQVVSEGLLDVGGMVLFFVVEVVVECFISFEFDLFELIFDFYLVENRHVLSPQKEVDYRIWLFNVVDVEGVFFGGHENRFLDCHLGFRLDFVRLLCLLLLLFFSRRD